MTEPVAYMWKTVRGTIVGLTLADDKNPHGGHAIPLYTAAQLHPRVKMTQKQYKEWQQVIKSIYPFNLYELFNLIFNPTEHKGEYASMRNIFSFDEGQKKLAKLWSDYDPENPEETIEIVPDMKWFVRSKDDIEVYLVETEEFVIDPYSCLSVLERKEAKQFNTKEEAELWTNPLTEAVQLPVEGE